MNTVSMWHTATNEGFVDPRHPTELPLTLRFLLTFDDGPHPHTGKVLRHLARNPVQPHIKGIFFVQTRHLTRGDSSDGRAMLTIEQAEGHVLGLRAGTTQGHLCRTGMSPAELERSLLSGKEVLDQITGTPTMLVRPASWLFNPSTFDCYGRHRLHLLLSDINAFDGVNWGMHLLRRLNFRSQLAGLQTRFLRRTLPVVLHTIPIVVTFHDTNSFTAEHLGDYLCLLVEEATRLGLPLHHKPFIDDRDELLATALRQIQHSYDTTAGPCSGGAVIWRLPAPSYHSRHGRLTPANIGFDDDAIDGQPDGPGFSCPASAQAEIGSRGSLPVPSARWLMRFLHLRRGQPRQTSRR
ncbi:MAG: polysaccharide deacetylase family protein [Nitrospira sp.]|nr:polysaccharide deacetylase family protein [Nitrospira sp.]